MKTVTLIPNPATPNLEAFGAYLVLTVGCTASAEPLTFLCEDHVADALLEQGAARAAEDKPTFEAERAWLLAYKGKFEFALSLQRQLVQKGKLSEKQWNCVANLIQKEKDFAAKRAAEAARTDFSLKPGTVIRLTKFIAEEIAAKAGCSRAHFAFEVLSVERETEKAYLATVRMAAVKTAHCCVCGLTLKNPVSISLGIGPECGSHWGVGQEPDALEKLAAQLRTFQVVQSWIPKKSIKERTEK